MRIVFTIEVGVDVPSYVQAGEKLDQLTTALDAIVGPSGSYDVGNFQARHRAIRRHPIDGSDEAQGMTMMSDAPKRSGPADYER